MIWLVAVFIPPLYFILRKKWGAFVLNAILYVIFLCTFIFGIGFIFWVLAMGHAMWHLRKEVMKEHADMIADSIVAKTKAAEAKGR